MRIVPLSIVLLLGAGLPIGCHKGADKAKVEELRQSLDALQKQSTDLKTRFMALRKQFETVPTDLPGFMELRGKFYAIEEGRGITDTKVMLLSGRLDAASSSGNRDEVQQISKEIAQTYDELHQLDELYVKLLHQVMSFQRQAAQQKQAEDEAAAAQASNAAPPATKTKRSKSKP